jgi:hypothetical protein
VDAVNKVLLRLETHYLQPANYTFQNSCKTLRYITKKKHRLVSAASDNLNRKMSNRIENSKTKEHQTDEESSSALRFQNAFSFGIIVLWFFLI